MNHFTNSQQELANRFAYHPPKTPEVGEAHSAVRTACFELAAKIVALTPEGREKSLAITKIEEAMMWANAAIARQG